MPWKLVRPTSGDDDISKAWIELQALYDLLLQDHSNQTNEARHQDVSTAAGVVLLRVCHFGADWERGAIWVISCCCCIHRDCLEDLVFECKIDSSRSFSGTACAVCCASSQYSLWRRW